MRRINPEPEGALFLFRGERHELAVDSNDGGRTVGYRLDGRDALLPASRSPHAYGSSFWTSPQSDWGWPPPPELDRDPWSAKVEDGVLVLRSRLVGLLGVIVTQRISMRADDGVVRFEYEVENRSQRSVHLAPWQNTRVAAGGTTLFPSDAQTEPFSTLALERSGACGVARSEPGKRLRSAKAFAHATEGWLAHLGQDLVFIKAFPVVPRGRQAPGQGSVEVYFDESGAFVEIEQQGRYHRIEPDARTRWVVHWLVERAPEGMCAKLEELEAFARAAVREKLGSHLTERAFRTLLAARTP